MRLHLRNLVAIMLSLVVAVSILQTTATMPNLVSADDSISLELSRAPSSTEPATATGSLEINLQSGKVTIQIHQASPTSTYEALFVNSGGNIQLGTFTSGNDGEANFQTTLDAGTYVGIFEILRIGLLQFVSESTSFTIGVTATGSETLSTGSVSSVISTQTSKTESTVASSQVQFHVEPPTRTVNAGAYARFNINIMVTGAASVFLAAKGTPAQSVVIFTEETGVADPEFHSDLIIVTSESTPIGSYGVMIISLINGQEFDTQVTVQVQASSTTTSGRTTTPTGVALGASVSTDQPRYEPGAVVNVRGDVIDERRSAVSDASVSLQVDGPAGREIVFMNNLTTDAAGVFRANFSLPSNATVGTYTSFVLASKSGYTGATTHTSFAVGISPTPSVVIREVYTTDISGNRSAVFSTGQTVLVWVVVENSGATFEGVIWLQVRDVNGTPVWIQFQISQLGTGQTVRIAFGFQLTAGLSAGLYTASALVSDKLISQGGSFFASASAQFAVAS